MRLSPKSPQPTRIAKAAKILLDRGIAVVPTDTCYALMARPDNRQGIERIARVKGMDVSKHLMSLVCADLSELARFARVDNWAYRILRRHLPGPYTFVLEASSEVPRILLSRRKTIGLRVPAHQVVLDLVRAVGGPLLSTSLKLPGEEYPLVDVEEMLGQLKGKVDLILDAGQGGLDVSSVVDLTDRPPKVVRRGAGDTDVFESVALEEATRA